MCVWIFLDIARHHFNKALGTDISEDAINYAKHTLNLDVQQIDFLNFDLPTHIYVGCLLETIAHLRQPHFYIDKPSTIMEEGSLLAITTGDIERVTSKICKHRWRLIHPPTHIHYFSKNH